MQTQSPATSTVIDTQSLAPLPISQRQQIEQNKLAKRLRRQVGEAIIDYNMIEANDRVMVCLSGGKDSYALLDVLLALKEKSPVPFMLIAFNLDQKHPGYPAHILPDYLTSLGIPFKIEEQDTYATVKRLIPEGKTMCSLCSR
jgi:tRNA 2-thiocytidine biosynthesis protein TtcA